MGDGLESQGGSTNRALFRDAPNTCAPLRPLRGRGTLPPAAGTKPGQGQHLLSQVTEAFSHVAPPPASGGYSSSGGGTSGEKDLDDRVLSNSPRGDVVGS